MNTPPPPSLDLVTLAIAIFSAWFSAETATVLATYSVILLGAIGGAGWSASSRGESTTRSTLLHMLAMVGLALILTVPLAELVARASGLNIRWIFAPMAVLISARPEWVVKRIRSAWDNRPGAAPVNQQQDTQP